MATENKSSSGHKFGQLIGDWFEEYFVFPLLKQVAENLNLFIDSRFVPRTARGDKILWKDVDDNAVDYDFILEIDGTEDKLGIPVGFIECFWRRGSRHSKDKARDDSGKLMPMRDTYPTARFLGIVGAGDFTMPAKNLITSRNIDLFYVPKEKMINAFLNNNLVIDYPDKSTEEEKAKLVNSFETAFDKMAKRKVVDSLNILLGNAVINSYVDRIRAKLSALPQEIRFILRHDSNPLVFNSVEAATEFLSKPEFKMENPEVSYVYEISYSDGTEFEKSVDDLEALKKLHEDISVLTNHMNELLNSSNK